MKELTKEAVHIVWAVCLLGALAIVALRMSGGHPNEPLGFEMKCPNGLEVKMSGMSSVSASKLIDRCEPEIPGE
jgi:hypothetical protein